MQYNSPSEPLMSTPPSPIAQLAAACEAEGLTIQNGEKIAAALAAEFKIQLDEVGILRLENDSLVFVHPPKLHNMARIPLNTTNSLAARTLTSKRPEIMNNFARTKQPTFFQMLSITTNHTLHKI